ncbi:hypothetical protein RM780_11470 [Streptomyces sp. DSM 44917]|uniref:Uncharacterized protein n=1 Tax=Streptomyces boetiae TaxID=3075541 RepID=A0ABU2L7N7_9ACTN|nr:hypothetical protein [Streptomyces sp. DSM 44917]MDT0307580.1 hypothetical protein [Streptomyces sp. DSM 44917]
MQLVGPPRPTVGNALRALEERLLRGGRRTALHNAWAAVQEDRVRAAARLDAERALRAAQPVGPAPRSRPS